MSTKPPARRNQVYPFKRVQVLVRVHPDDKAMMLDMARQLNKKREEHSR